MVIIDRNGGGFGTSPTILLSGCANEPTLQRKRIPKRAPVPLCRSTNLIPHKEGDCRSFAIVAIAI